MAASPAQALYVLKRSMFIKFAAAELNKMSAHAYAKLAGYTPMDMPSLVQVVGKKSPEAIEAEDGRGRLVMLELAILEQLSSVIRCAVGCLGEGWGATASCSIICVPTTFL
jgi:hypothetical protein